MGEDGSTQSIGPTTAVNLQGRRPAEESTLHETVNRLWRNGWIMDLPSRAVKLMENNTGIHVEYFLTYLLGETKCKKNSKQPLQ